MSQKKTKVVSMLVTVSGNAALSAAEIRREVRHLIRGYGGYLSFDPEGNEIDIRVVSIVPVKRKSET